MESLVGIIFFITAFGAWFGVMYFYYTTRNRERMALIEKGADPAMFKTPPKNYFKRFVITFGMLCAGGGLGTLAGNILDKASSLEEEVAYISMIFLFTGASLVASYFFVRMVKD